jgi:predicted metal-binding membrane protein
VREARHSLAVIMTGLVGTAWLSLYAWEQSPYGRYLDHGRWTDLGWTASICRVLPGGDWVVPAALYGGGWMLMTAAMMLPSITPLLRRFDRLTAGRGDRATLMGCLIAGYLLAWFGFGLAAHALDLAVQAAVRVSPWLQFNAWVVGAGVLAAAGLFQFSALKHHCVARCRTPVGFLVRHWTGRAPRRDALLLGLDHGVFCVGCCWALMLLMFVVGTGNFGWMLALGAVMAIEKNAVWGRWLSTPLGAALLVWAAVIVVANA